MTHARNHSLTVAERQSVRRPWPEGNTAATSPWRVWNPLWRWWTPSASERWSTLRPVKGSVCSQSADTGRVRCLTSGGTVSGRRQRSLGHSNTRKTFCLTEGLIQGNPIHAFTFTCSTCTVYVWEKPEACFTCNTWKFGLVPWQTWNSSCGIADGMGLLSGLFRADHATPRLYVTRSVFARGRANMCVCVCVSAARARVKIKMK